MEGVSKKEGNMLQRKSQGDALHFDGMACGHSTCGQRIRQVGKKERKGKVAGWSTEKTEESRRNISQEEIDKLRQVRLKGGVRPFRGPGFVFFLFFFLTSIADDFLKHFLQQTFFELLGWYSWRPLFFFLLIFFNFFHFLIFFLKKKDRFFSFFLFFVCLRFFFFLRVLYTWAGERLRALRSVVTKFSSL